MIFDEKSPGSVLSYFQSYPCGNLYFVIGQRLASSNVDFGFGAAHVNSILFSPYAPGAAQFAWSVAMGRFHSPNQYGTRHTVLLGDHVQAPVHAIDEIYVDISCRSKHYLAAFGFTAECVTGWVVLRIGFYLKNTSSEYLSAI